MFWICDLVTKSNFIALMQGKSFYRIGRKAVEANNPIKDWKGSRKMETKKARATRF